MSETKVNSDLLKCENDFFIEESKTKSLLITKKAQKSAISGQFNQKNLKTEKISSSVLSRAKQFLDITKRDDNMAEKCDLVEQNDSQTDENDGKQVIEMNLMLFENKKQSNNESSDEESESTELSDSSSEDSEEDSRDCPPHSDKDDKNEDKHELL